MTKNFMDLATKESDNLAGPYQKYVFRPLATPFTILLANTDVKPTTVTILGLAIGILAAILIAIVETDSLIWGVIIWHLAKICDFVDGNLARAKSQKTYAGKMLDGFVDISVNIAVVLGFGFHVGGLYETACFTFALLYLLGHFSYFRYLSMYDIMSERQRPSKQKTARNATDTIRVKSQPKTSLRIFDDLISKTEINLMPLAMVLGCLAERPRTVVFALCFCLGLRGSVNLFGSIFFTLSKLQIRR